MVRSAIVISVPWQLDVAYKQLQLNLVNRYTINYYISSKIRTMLARWVGQMGGAGGWGWGRWADLRRRTRVGENILASHLF